MSIRLGKQEQGGGQGIPMGLFNPSAGGGGGVRIDDENISTSTTWSSDKINTDISNVSAAVGTVAEDVSVINGQITALQGDMLQVETDVTHLEEKVKEIELFKFPNATIIGEPTIQNGQVSNFSTVSYLQFPFVLDLHDQAFQIDFCFTTATNVQTQQNILDSNFGVALAIRDGKGLMAISSNGTSWDIGQSIGTIDIQSNTTYYARLIWNRLQYKTFLSTDGVNYTEDMVLVGAVRPFPRTIFIGGCDQLETGHEPHPFLGTINLNKAFMSINNSIIWQGMDDVGLATRADVSLDNIDEKAVELIKNLASEVSPQIPVATTEVAGIVKPDGETVTIDEDGTIHAQGGSSITPLAPLVDTEEVKGNTIGYTRSSVDPSLIVATGKETIVSSITATNIKLTNATVVQGRVNYPSYVEFEFEQGKTYVAPHTNGYAFWLLGYYSETGDFVPVMYNNLTAASSQYSNSLSLYYGGAPLQVTEKTDTYVAMKLYNQSYVNMSAVTGLTSKGSISILRYSLSSGEFCIYQANKTGLNYITNTTIQAQLNKCTHIRTFVKTGEPVEYIRKVQFDGNINTVTLDDLLALPNEFVFEDNVVNKGVTLKYDPKSFTVSPDGVLLADLSTAQIDTVQAPLYMAEKEEGNTVGLGIGEDGFITLASVPVTLTTAASNNSGAYANLANAKTDGSALTELTGYIKIPLVEGASLITPLNTSSVNQVLFCTQREDGAFKVLGATKYEAASSSTTYCNLAYSPVATVQYNTTTARTYFSAWVTGGRRSCLHTENMTVYRYINGEWQQTTYSSGYGSSYGYCTLPDSVKGATHVLIPCGGTGIGSLRPYSDIIYTTNTEIDVMNLTWPQAREIANEFNFGDVRKERFIGILTDTDSITVDAQGRLSTSTAAVDSLKTEVDGLKATKENVISAEGPLQKKLVREGASQNIIKQDANNIYFPYDSNRTGVTRLLSISGVNRVQLAGLQLTDDNEFDWSQVRYVDVPAYEDVTVVGPKHYNGGSGSVTAFMLGRKEADGTFVPYKVCYGSTCYTLDWESPVASAWSTWTKCASFIYTTQSFAGMTRNYWDDQVIMLATSIDGKLQFRPGYAARRNDYANSYPYMNIATLFETDVDRADINCVRCIYNAQVSNGTTWSIRDFRAGVMTQSVPMSAIYATGLNIMRELWDLPLIDFDEAKSTQLSLAYDNTTIKVNDQGQLYADVHAEVPVATTDAVGTVKPDGTTVTIDEDGTIHAAGGGEMPPLGTGLTLSEEGALQVEQGEGYSGGYKVNYIGGEDVVVDADYTATHFSVNSLMRMEFDTPISLGTHFEFVMPWTYGTKSYSYNMPFSMLRGYDEMGNPNVFLGSSCATYNYTENLTVGMGGFSEDVNSYSASVIGEKRYYTIIGDIVDGAAVIKMYRTTTPDITGANPLVTYNSGTGVTYTSFGTIRAILFGYRYASQVMPWNNQLFLKETVLTVGGTEYRPVEQTQMPNMAVATSDKYGIIKPDMNTIVVNEFGVLSANVDAIVGDIGTALDRINGEEV